MSPRPKRPTTPILTVLPYLLAAGAVYGSYQWTRSDPETTADLAEYLQAGPVVTAYAGAVERQWIDEAFPEHYLPAPVTHLPCPTGIRAAAPASLRISEALAVAEDGRVDDAVAKLGELDQQDSSGWVAGLALGALLVRHGRLSEAETVLERVYDRQAVQSTIREAVATAAQNRWQSGPATEDVRGAIHLLHAFGYVQIATHRGGDKLWHALKNPIGCAKLLALRGATDRLRRMPTWAEHRLRAPGCQDAADSLTTLDLYNNLIVGYLRNRDFEETPERREREFARGYDDPPEKNPLQTILRSAAEQFDPEREYWVWAISNAERLLKQRRQSGTGELTNARLAYNLAALTESAVAESPPEARQALLDQERSLLKVAYDRRQTISPRQLPELDQGLVRLTLAEAVRTGRLKSLPDEVTAHLTAAQQDVARALGFALVKRRQPEALLPVATGNDDEGARHALGGRAAAWLGAARRDLAASLALRGSEVPREEKLWWVWWARDILTPEDAKPDELVALEKELGFLWRLKPRNLLRAGAVPPLFAALVGILVWALSYWVTLQLRQRRDLLTSFYRIEAKNRLGRSK